jgi:uncharacterized membrane protein
MRSVEERQMDRFIGGLLRAGVLASAAIVLIGTFVSFGQGGGAVSAYGSFAEGPTSLRTIEAIIAEALAGNGRGIVQLGVLVLVATPIARVVVSVLAFAVQRDGTYVCVTLVVLAVLGFSLFGSVPLERGDRAGHEGVTTTVSGPPPRSPVEPAGLEAPAPR